MATRQREVKAQDGLAQDGLARNTVDQTNQNGGLCAFRANPPYDSVRALQKRPGFTGAGTVGISQVTSTLTGAD